AARIVAPLASCRPTALRRWIERDLYVPAGNTTVPPPAVAAAAIALLMAGESLVEPSPLAPNFVTSNVPAAHAVVRGTAHASSPAASTAAAPSTPSVHLRMAHIARRAGWPVKRMLRVAEPPIHEHRSERRD